MVTRAAMQMAEEIQRDIRARISRIEGQARGVQRMVDEGRDCADIVQQIAAMRAALGKVAAAIVAENLEECVRRGLAGEGGDQVRRAKRALMDLV